MASVVCKVTKERGKSQDFYCVIEKGKKTYYKSEAIYKAYIKEQEQKKNVIYFILDLLGYDYSPYLLKKIKLLNEKYTYEVIFKTFKNNESKIKHCLINKLSDAKEVQKINYIFKIIENEINDVKSEIVTNNKQEKNISKIEIDIDGLNNIKYVPIKSKNIAQYLEGEDI